MSRLRRASDGAALRPLPPAPAVSPDKLPECPATADGFLQILGVIDAALRWNETARAVEVRLPGSDDWRHSSDEVVDDLMVACSRVAVIRRGGSVLPWEIPGARRERRAIGHVARRNRVEGEGNGVYQAVRAWSDRKAAGGVQLRVTLAAVLDGAEVLHRYESPARAPRAVYGAAKAALTDAGWEWRTARVGNRAPQRLWCSPFGREGVSLG